MLLGDRIMTKLAACRTRDYKKEYARDHASPTAKRHRAMRNKWNRRLKGKVPAGHEIDHIKQLRNGGGNDMNNIRFLPVSQNRSEHHRKTASAVEIDREKVRDYIGGARRDVGALIGGGLGVLAPGKAKILAIPAGALLGRYAGGRSVDDQAVTRSIKRLHLEDPNVRNRKLSDLEMTTMGNQGGYYIQDPRLHEYILQQRFKKRASFLGSKQMNHVEGGLEGRMAKRQLKEICEMADELYCCIDDHDDLHEWVQVKLATIHDRLNSVHSFMMYEMKHPKHEPILGKYASVTYRGQTFPGYNQPIRNTDGGQHKMKVLAKKGDEVRLVRFGHRGYKHNYSSKAKSNYLTRSAGIRDKSGNLTMNDKFSPNYWSRRVLWPKGQKADGTAKVRRRREA